MLWCVGVCVCGCVGVGVCACVCVGGGRVCIYLDTKVLLTRLQLHVLQYLVPCVTDL